MWSATTPKSFPVRYRFRGYRQNQIRGEPLDSIPMLWAPLSCSKHSACIGYSPIENPRKGHDKVLGHRAYKYCLPSFPTRKAACPNSCSLYVRHNKKRHWQNRGAVDLVVEEPHHFRHTQFSWSLGSIQNLKELYLNQ